jgi:hypothetical protein
MLEFREMVIDLGNLWRATTRSLLCVGRSLSEARLRAYPVVDAPQPD